MKNKGFLVALGLVLALQGLSVSAKAWEEDFHYGLTKWLAANAGFCPPHAEAVAVYAIAPDDDPQRNALELTKRRIIPLGDVSAARIVSRWHFPSLIDVPARPTERYVCSGCDQARSIFVTAANPNQQNPLLVFGEGLHLFQDSWSHEGVPGTIGLRDNIFWAHPELRGGPLRHDADLTHLYPYSALLSASQVYLAMLTFLNRYQRYACIPPERWDDIKADVENFIEADSKLKKRRWFDDTRVMYSRKDFLDRVNLPER